MIGLDLSLCQMLNQSRAVLPLTQDHHPSPLTSLVQQTPNLRDDLLFLEGFGHIGLHTEAEGALRIAGEQVDRLESEIDDINAALDPLESFILPGGTPVAAQLHMARTIARRAERLVTALSAEETVNPNAVKYLNRLSDLLFVLSRAANKGGKDDVLWVPGANR